jgi:hypothetical protein
LNAHALIETEAKALNVALKGIAVRHPDNQTITNFAIGQASALEKGKSQFLQSEGNEAQMRNKERLNRELLAKTPKTKAATRGFGTRASAAVAAPAVAPSGNGGASAGLVYGELPKSKTRGKPDAPQAAAGDGLVYANLSSLKAKTSGKAKAGKAASGGAPAAAAGAAGDGMENYTLTPSGDAAMPPSKAKPAKAKASSRGKSGGGDGMESYTLAPSGTGGKKRGR